MNQKEIKSQLTPARPAARRFGLLRLVCIVLGMLLLSAAVLKATDMELFVRQIREYRILSNHALLVLGAWFVITLECTLGVGLVLAYRPGLMLFLTAVLLLAFIGATTWAWLVGSAEDCGCFGAWLNHSPGQAAFGNLILLMVTVAVRVRFRAEAAVRNRAKALVTGMAFVIGIALPLVFGFQISRVAPPSADITGEAMGPLKVRGLEGFDLNEGTYLIIVMTTDCDHCLEAVPEINLLVGVPGLPTPVALCTNDESQRIDFIEAFQPLFPVGQIEENVFWRLLGDGNVPRVFLVRDGHILRVWDQVIPDENSIRALVPMRALRPAGR